MPDPSCFEKCLLETCDAGDTMTASCGLAGNLWLRSRIYCVFGIGLLYSDDSRLIVLLLYARDHAENGLDCDSVTLAGRRIDGVMGQPDLAKTIRRVIEGEEHLVVTHAVQLVGIQFINDRLARYGSPPSSSAKAGHPDQSTSLLVTE